MDAILRRIRELRDKATVGRSLEVRAARGSLWLGAGSGIEYGLRLIRNVILTRLIAPEAFGLMALVLAVHTFFQAFTEIGIQDAVIQSPRGERKSYLNGAWWLAVTRGAVLYLIAYFAAPWVAGFYDEAELVALIRVAFLGILLNGAVSANAYVALKKMDFRRWVFIQTGGAACGIFFAILLGFLIPGVWALVVGFTVEIAARVILSYWVCPFLPGFEFDRESLRGLFKFTRGVFGLPLLFFLFTQADIFVVGKLCSSAVLGVYSMAVVLARTPFHLAGRIIGLVSGPAFSELKDQPERLNEIVLKVTSAIAMLGVPAILALSLYARPLIELLYGSQYGQGALPFAIILGVTLLQIVSVPVSRLYFMIGRPALHRYFTLIRAILMISMVYPAVQWFGPAGAAAASLLAMVVAYILQMVRLRRLTGLDLGRYASVFLPGLGASAIVVAIWVLTRGVIGAAPLVQLAFGLVGCFLGYGLVAACVLNGHLRAQFSSLRIWKSL